MYQTVVNIEVILISVYCICLLAGYGIRSRKLLDFVFGRRHKVSFTVTETEFNCHLSAGYASRTSSSVKKYVA